MLSWLRHAAVGPENRKGKRWLNLFSARRGLLNAILDFCRHYDPPADTRPRNDEGNLKLVMPRLPCTPFSFYSECTEVFSLSLPPLRAVNPGENPAKRHYRFVYLANS